MQRRAVRRGNPEGHMQASVVRKTLDFPDFCAALGIGQTKGREVIRKGRVPVIRIDRRIVIANSVLDDILAGRISLSDDTSDDDNAAG
jgi:hypothetical protein